MNPNPVAINIKVNTANNIFFIEKPPLQNNSKYLFIIKEKNVKIVKKIRW